MKLTAEQSLERLCDLSQEILKLQIEFDTLKAQFRKCNPHQNQGEFGTVTVYKVKKTTIKKHTRSSYTAVRVTPN